MTSQPAGPAGQAGCDPAELRTLFLFEKLTSEQLAWLCEHGRVETIGPGPVYAEGDAATCFYVLLDGTITLRRRVGGEDVEVTRTSARGVYGGAFQAYLGDQVPQRYNNSMWALAASRFFVLEAAAFARLMTQWFPMAVHLLEGLFFGTQASQRAIGQRERLLALGSLTAGLTHELNNPASAAVRAVAALRERVAGMRGKLAIVAAGGFEPAELRTLIQLQERAAERVAKSAALSGLAASDLEDDLAGWLDDRGIARAWDLAPAFVQAGLDVAWLDQVEATVGGGAALDGALRWLNYTIETELLMNEIEDAATRISTLVGAAKEYSRLDRAPFGVADIHELLDSTLVMLSAKIGPGITVIRDYDRSLPPVHGYLAELNQVWTNLVDNAVAAMNGNGTLTVRTARAEDRLLIEFGDTGTGVPDAIRDRIFEPFFTTKPVGEGTGLGLDISWRIIVNRHHGDIKVESRPGDTRFRVWLPADPAGTEREEDA